MVAQAVDQLVHLARCDRIEPGGRLVEEDDRRIVEQRARERDALAEALREAAAGIVGPAGEVDRRQRLPDPRLRLCELVQSGEELEVLGDGETQVEAGVLGHHRDSLADLDAVRRVERQPRDTGRARGGGDQGGEHAHGRRLAGAVRAEEAEHLAGADAEGDVVDREPLTEPLRQVLDDERRLVRRARRRPARGERAKRLPLLDTSTAGSGLALGRLICRRGRLGGPGAAGRERDDGIGGNDQDRDRDPCRRGAEEDEHRDHGGDREQRDRPAVPVGRPPARPTRRRWNHRCDLINPASH